MSVGHSNPYQAAFGRGGWKKTGVEQTIKIRLDLLFLLGQAKRKEK